MKRTTFLQYFVRGLMSAAVLFMAVVMAVVPMAVMTGCTPAQIATFDQTITTIENHLPQLAQMATGISALVAPEYAPLIAPGAGVIAADANLLKTLVDDYKATQDPGILAKIDSYYQDISSHLSQIVAAVGVKDPTSTAAVNLFAGVAGEILQFVQDLTAKQPAATAQLIRLKMPHVFGGSVIGLHAVAFSSGDVEADMVLNEMVDNSAPPAKGKKHVIHSTRQIAKTWNVLAKNHTNAKLSVPRARVLGLPIPFTGR